MKITGITANNYLRIQSADITVHAPILLIAGENEQGKTSLADAIYHAFTGTARRVGQKKDYKQLVHDGQKNGAVAVEVLGDDGQGAAFTVTIPADKRTVEGAVDADQPLMPILLDQHRFIAMKPEERRALLFTITGTRVRGKEILDRLHKKGANAEKATTVGAALVAGFAAGHDLAKEKASEARGAWKAIAGENYGSKKAEDWIAPKPEYDASKIESLTASIAQANEKLAEGNRQLGVIDERRKAERQRQERRSALVALVDEIPRRKAKLDADQAIVDEWEAKVADLQRRAGSGPKVEPEACPHCGGLLEIHAGKLHAHDPSKQGEADAIALLPNARATLERVTRVRDTSKKALDSAEGAKLALTELDAEEVEEIPELGGLQATMLAHEQSRKALQGTLDAILADKRRADVADENTKKAAGYHRDVQEWEAIQEWLAPSGIQAEILSEAMKPFNERLSLTAQRTGWDLVAIDPEMNITVGGRAYSLCSASARWRAEAAISEAISFISKTRTLMLDEMEILIGANRLAFLTWMHQLAEGGEVDTAIVIGSFKEAPRCPPTFHVEWVSAGMVGVGEMAEEA